MQRSSSSVAAGLIFHLALLLGAFSGPPARGRSHESVSPCCVLLGALCRLLLRGGPGQLVRRALSDPASNLSHHLSQQSLGPRLWVSELSG